MTTAHYNIHAYFSNSPSNHHDYVLTSEGTFKSRSQSDGTDFESEAEAMSEFNLIDSIRLEQEWKGFHIIKISIEKTTVGDDDEVEMVTVAEKEITVDTA